MKAQDFNYSETVLIIQTGQKRDAFSYMGYLQINVKRLSQPACKSTPKQGGILVLSMSARARKSTQMFHILLCLCSRHRPRYHMLLCVFKRLVKRSQLNKHHLGSVFIFHLICLRSLRRTTVYVPVRSLLFR